MTNIVFCNAIRFRNLSEGQVRPEGFLRAAGVGC